MKALLLIVQKFKNVAKIFSLDFFLKFNWALTVLFFVLVLFFALLVWWKNFILFSAPISSEIINEENSQNLEEKNQKIKNIMEELEKRRSAFDNFPASALPRERVFKSNFVWDEESAPVEETEAKPGTSSTPEASAERLVF